MSCFDAENVPSPRRGTSNICYKVKASIDMSMRLHLFSRTIKGTKLAPHAVDASEDVSEYVRTTRCLVVDSAGYDSDSE